MPVREHATDVRLRLKCRRIEGGGGRTPCADGGAQLQREVGRAIVGERTVLAGAMFTTPFGISRVFTFVLRPFSTAAHASILYTPANQGISVIQIRRHERASIPRTAKRPPASLQSPSHWAMGWVVKFPCAN